jgi:enoyl-CoA hydratase/carnithine racemase
MSSLLQSLARDGITTLTLDRPERGNALGPELVEALHMAIEACHTDPDCHTLLLRGAGRHFCTGLDLSDLDRCGDGELLRRLVRIEQLLDAVWRSPLRTVAIAHGRTWGAGADLFAACERRIVAPGTTFRFPGARFGIVLGTRRLAERLGADRARRAVIDGLELDADEALSCGLAQEQAPMPETTDAAQAAVDNLGNLATPITAATTPALPPPAVDPTTAQALRAATRPGADTHADADLAALVRSAARPGLQARIQSYRDSLQKAR